MYDVFSDDYDRFVNWKGRLAFELPFIIDQLEQANVKRVLDAAAGTAMHAIALAQRGYQAAAADLSQGMVDKAKQNAVAAGIELDIKRAGFGELAEAFSLAGLFDALLCLGNSLPHLLTLDALDEALVDFAASLRPGGLLLIQNRNFDAVLHDRQRWMDPQSHLEEDREWIFLRLYDFLDDGLINFNIITLGRTAGNPWRQRVDVAKLYPQRQVELGNSLQKAGFENVSYYGGLDGSPFDLQKSGNLVISAKKPVD